MSDSIDRTLAIATLVMAKETGSLLCKELKGVIEVLNRMPSAQSDTGYSDGYADGYKQGLKDAQPERKKGKWINEGVYGEGHAQCSIRCNNPLCNFHYIGYLGDYNFCPNCGADMRGEQNG